MEERNKLIKDIYEFDKKIERDKSKRALTVILLYMFVNSVLYYILINAITGYMNISKFIVCIVVSSIFSIISYFANISIFAQLFEKGNQESTILRGMEKKLKEYDEKNNIEEKFPVENFFKNRHMWYG